MPIFLKMPAKPPTPAVFLGGGTVPRSRSWALAVLALATLLIGALHVSSARATDAKYEGISADGGTVFFTSKDRLVSGDTDNRTDLFARAFDLNVGEYVTRQVSLSPTGGNAAHDVQYSGVSADGTKAFFVTKEPLTPDDDDKESDIYMRDLAANTTVRVSRGESSCEAQGCGNGEVSSNVILDGVIPAGTKVFFSTTEKLSSGDTDVRLDIYMRDLAANTTVRVSRGDSTCEAQGCGNGDVAVSVVDDGVIPAGTKVFFTTMEKLSPDDTDSPASLDIYMRDLSGGTTQLVSEAGICPAGLQPGENCDPNYAGASADGSHAFLETNEQLSVADGDKSQDVYDWSGGIATLVSVGADGVNREGVVTYAGSSASGSEVLFHTSASLDETADTDAARDVYRRSGGVTSLVSVGDSDCLPVCGNGTDSATLVWVSPDDSTSAVLFTTAEPLTSDDEDDAQDIYERAGNATTLISQGDASCAATECGNGPLDSFFARASNDGLHVFFVTDESLLAPDPEEPLLPADTDASQDIYERFSGVTRLVSTGTINGNGAFDANLHGVSESGSRAFFVTKERLSENDDFDQEDVYSRSVAGTQLVSVGNNPDLQLGPPPPTLQGTNPASPNVSTEPAVFGQAEAGAAIKLYDTANCEEDVPVATGTAAQLLAPGITVIVPIGSTKSFWATAEVDGIVSPCSNAVTYKQGTPPSPPPPDPGGGSGGGGTGTGSGGGTTTSQSGLTGGEPKTHNGGIPFVTPETRITFGPSFKTRKRKVVFRFFDATEQPGSRFFCKLDRIKWRSCGSPMKLKGLARGKHVFQVLAENAIGVKEAQSTKRRFKVVRG
jgi:Tol biopolymer transport system component